MIAHTHTHTFRAAPLAADTGHGNGQTGSRTTPTVAGIVRDA